MILSRFMIFKFFTVFHMKILINIEQITKCFAVDWLIFGDIVLNLYFLWFMTDTIFIICERIVRNLDIII